MKTSQTVAQFLSSQVAQTTKTGCRFVGITYTNSQGETARHNLILGVNLRKLYQDDLQTLQTILPSCQGLRRQACLELISSVTESLKKGIGNNSQYTLKGYYTGGEVKSHDDNLYLRGYRVSKTIISSTNTKTVNHNPLTVEKNELKKLLKTNRINTYSIAPGKLHSIRINGLTVSM